MLIVTGFDPGSGVTGMARLKIHDDKLVSIASWDITNLNLLRHVLESQYKFGAGQSTDVTEMFVIEKFIRIGASNRDATTTAERVGAISFFAVLQGLTFIYHQPYRRKGYLNHAKQWLPDVSPHRKDALAHCFAHLDSNYPQYGEIWKRTNESDLDPSQR